MIVNSQRYIIQEEFLTNYSLKIYFTKYTNNIYINSSYSLIELLGNPYKNVFLLIKRTTDENYDYYIPTNTNPFDQ